MMPNTPLKAEKIARLLQALGEHLISLGQDIRLILEDEPQQEQLDPDRDPQDTCKVGDPDPTPETGEKCNALNEDTGRLCRRWPDHGDRQHVAIQAGRVRAVW